MMRRIDDVLDLVPYREYPLSVVENPIAVLARSSPGNASWVLSRSLAVREVEARMHSLTSVSRDHAAIVCTWLNRRNPGERNIAVETSEDSSEHAFLFGRGERIRARTRVAIW